VAAVIPVDPIEIVVIPVDPIEIVVIPVEPPVAVVITMVITGVDTTEMVITVVAIMQADMAIIEEVRTITLAGSSGSHGSLTTAIPMATIHIATPTLIPMRIRTILT
jgi:hypothetical protein